MRANNPTLSLSTGATSSLIKKAQIAASVVVLATGLAVPQLANADSGVDSGGGALSAGADVDFQIIIPRFIYFQVGDAIAGAESVNFDMTGVEDQIGNSVAQAGTGGNLGGGAVDVVVRGNAGDMTITETNSTTNGLEDGGPGKAIDLGEITTTGGGVVVAPILSNGSSNTSAVTAVGGIVNTSDTWTYTYDNTTIPLDGTYTSTVTYTASAP